MSDFFIDLSAATNGTGTAVSPYNSLVAAAPTTGNTYWIRRAVPLAGNITYTQVNLPSNVRLVGWPMSGDVYYASRPAVPSWDADTETHAIIYNRIKCQLVHTVQLHRIFVNFSHPVGITLTNSPIETSASPLIMYQSSNIQIYNTKVYCDVFLRSSTSVGIPTINILYCRNIALYNVQILDGAKDRHYFDYAVNLQFSNAIVADIQHTMIEVGASNFIYTAPSGEQTQALYNILSCSDVYVKVVVDHIGDILPIYRWSRSVYLSAVTSSIIELDFTSFPDNNEVWPLYINDAQTTHTTIHIKGARIGTLRSRGNHTFIHAKTDLVETRPSFPANVFNPITALDGANVTVYPFTPGGTVTLNTATNYAGELSNRSFVHVHHQTAHPVIQYTDGVQCGVWAYTLPNDKTYYRNVSGSINSTTIARTGSPHGYRVAMTLKQLDKSMPLLLGTDYKTPYIADVTAGGSTLTIHLAGIPHYGNIPRPGDVVMEVKYTDSNGEQFFVTGDLVYNVTDTWSGVDDYKPFTISTHISPDIACGVRAILKFNYCERYRYILADSSMEVTHD